MTDQLTARCLTLDRSARIVPAGDRLHVVQRRGAFDLRGKGLEQLHERLAPMLDGRFTRAEVLASVGPRADAVDRYLTGLATSGVLREGDPPRDLPPAFPRARPGAQVLSTAGPRVAVTLAGEESSDAAALRLSFATRVEIERRLLELRARPAAGRIWVECDATAGAQELARRASVARHLLAIELGAENRHELSIFRLAPDRLVLHRLALVAPPSAPLDTLPAQLGFVRLIERRQLPLVAMVAELPGFGRRRVAYGLDATQIRAALAVEFLAREALLHRAARDASGARHGVGANVGRGGRRRNRTAIAPSPTARAEALLCAWAVQSRRARGRGRDLDLLAIEPPSPRVASLQDVLGRRRRAWRVQLDERLAPLVIVRSAAGAVVRVGFEEALAEVLLRAIARELDLDEPGAIACAPSLLGEAARRARARALLEQVPQGSGTRLGRFRWLGSTHYYGIAGS